MTKLKNSELDRSTHATLVQEIKDRCRRFVDFCVVWCRRSANGCAHVLAKASCNSLSSVVWLYAPPEMIVPVFRKELCGVGV